VASDQGGYQDSEAAIRTDVSDRYLHNASRPSLSSRCSRSRRWSSSSSSPASSFVAHELDCHSRDERGADGGERVTELVLHLRCGKPEDAIATLRELTVSTCIGARAAFVIATVDFDDEPRP
jgi:hypothetical protein